MLLQGIVEFIRCIHCIQTGKWPQRLHDVEELENQILAERRSRQGRQRQMTDPQVGVLMLALFIVVIMLGFPIAFTLMAMGVGFAFYYFDFREQPIFALVVRKTYAVMSNDVLMPSRCSCSWATWSSAPIFSNRLFRSIQLAARNPGLAGDRHAGDLRAVRHRHRHRRRGRDADGAARLSRRC